MKKLILILVLDLGLFFPSFQAHAYSTSCRTSPNPLGGGSTTYISY